MKNFFSPWVILVIMLSAQLMLPSGVSGAFDCEQWAGKAVKVQGEVIVKRSSTGEESPLRRNDTLCPGDMITVAQHSRAAIRLPNRTLAQLDQGTSLIFTEPEEARPLLIDILRGIVHLMSRTPQALDVKTPFVNAGVEGTEFLVSVLRTETLLTVFEGAIRAENDLGSLVIAQGQSAKARAGTGPEPYIVARPRDAVQWALYYLPLYDISEADIPDEGAPWQSSLRQSIGNSRKGDLKRAFSSLEAVDEGVPDERFSLYRASLLLAVGRVDEAQEQLSRLLAVQEQNSDALALQSIIAVSQNDTEKAVSLAGRAAAADPRSAAAQMAMSYALQSQFDLDGALMSSKNAVAYEPENSLAWARLAEMYQSFGELDRALEAAQKAAALNPGLSRSQTVLGYAYLTQVNIRDARQAFEKAIVLDQADPLPRMGLGLAKIRGGQLEEGRSIIEVAAILDPGNSLVRSYLGKAYHEEKEAGLSGDQYAMAKELDPKDPTPFFYDAIRKQTLNRPVEALQDMEKAIALNDNRAIYRSKLLLDEDLAARSAAQARIYSDLGFEQLALVEGWKSVNTDPGNYSAHRFLADSYSVLPRHEIARVSELLQSQLLQPLNITPIQPRLGESNLFLISAGGPAGLSFNEFNPLFNRNRLTFQGGGLSGENDTYGAEGIVSGIYNKFSFSGGYTHFETHGWRDNSDQDDDIANVFAQIQLTHKTSLQAEYRYRETEKGDLLLRFEPDNFFPNRREKEETSSIRLGFHHAFSPASRLIGNFVHSDSDLDVDDIIELSTSFELFPGFSVPATLQTIPEVRSENEAYGGELQYLFRSKYVDVVSGAGYFDIDSTITTFVNTTITLEPPFPPTPIPVPVDPDTTDLDTEHTNLYLYSYISVLENLTFTIGASGDFFDGGVSDVEDKDQFNPKFGVIWNPVPDTTIRAAVFRTLTRTLVDAQTVEPTQVAGFNQFFDENRSTDAWRYGGAVDQKFSESLYGGVEFSQRDLEVPLPVGTSRFPNERLDREEYLGRAYLFWTPHTWLGLSAEYLYEKFEYDMDSEPEAEEVKTNSFPLGISFSHPSGLGASIKATYYDHEGDFKRVDVDPQEYFHGEDNFWVVDAAINYRLPRRYGFITVGAKNLFDEEFKYYETDVKNLRIQPDSFFFVRATFAIP